MTNTDNNDYNENLITEAVIVCKRITIRYGVEIFKVGYMNLLDPTLNENANIQFYHIRERYSNCEKYYAMSKKNYDDEIMREHIFNLMKEDIESILYTYI